MRLAIIGSRDFTNYYFLRKTILQEYSVDKISLIVSGGARGVDSLGEQFAKEFDIPTQIFPADWEKYGKSAGFRRNHDIINKAEEVIAFWDGKSSGTKASIDLARKQNKKVKVVLIDWLLGW